MSQDMSVHQKTVNLALTNPQIAAALSANSSAPPQQHQQQMQNPNEPQQHFVNQNMGMGPPGAGGPIRVVQQVGQMRSVPYSSPQGQQIRQVSNNPHYSPINQNQFQGNAGQQITITQRPIMQHQSQIQHLHPQQQQINAPQPMGIQPQQHQHIQNINQHQQVTGQPQQQVIAPIQQQQQQPPPQPQPQVHNSTTTGSIMEKSRLDELMLQISKNIVLEDNVKDALVEYADDFVTSIIDKACRMIKHRGSKKIEARDIEFVLQNVYNMPTVPRAAVHVFGGAETIDLVKERNMSTEAHKQRLAMLKKQLRKI